MKNIVIYHASCTDGFGAAYAAWKKLGDDAAYVPMHYNQVNEPADLLKALQVTGINDHAIYILDFSFPRPVLEWLSREARQLVWLDHHKSAFEAWTGSYDRGDYYYDDSGSVEITLDDNRSGAMIAWMYFHGDKVPDLIRHIDDRDRWVFAMPESKAIHAALAAQAPWSFPQWSLLTHPANYGELVIAGDAILEALNKQIAQSVRVAEVCRIASPEGAVGWDGLAVNTPVNISEVGHELANASGTYGLVWYYDHKTHMANCSLRSNGDYDVSALAKLYGGGGHKNAAGFRTPMTKLLEWVRVPVTAQDRP